MEQQRKKAAASARTPNPALGAAARSSTPSAPDVETFLDELKEAAAREFHPTGEEVRSGADSFSSASANRRREISSKTRGGGGSAGGGLRDSLARRDAANAKKKKNENTAAATLAGHARKEAKASAAASAAEGGRRTASRASSSSSSAKRASKKRGSPSRPLSASDQIERDVRALMKHAPGVGAMGADAAGELEKEAGARRGEDWRADAEAGERRFEREGVFAAVGATLAGAFVVARRRLLANREEAAEAAASRATATGDAEAEKAPLLDKTAR